MRLKFPTAEDKRQELIMEAPTREQVREGFLEEVVLLRRSER